MEILNGKEVCHNFNFSTTLLYKFRNAGLPYHQFPGRRAYYLSEEVENWLKQAGFHQKKIWSK